MNPDEEIFDLPRFLSFIELAYLYEGVKLVDEHFAKEIAKIENDKNRMQNLNTTRQGLLRAAFISSYATFEQNVDELVTMEGKKNKASISPSDLRHRGIKRSLVFATKVLGREIDENRDHWEQLKILQNIRNHLVHYGPGFSDSPEHEKRHKSFRKSEFANVSLAISFTLNQFECIIKLYLKCLSDFRDQKSCSG